MTLSDTIVRRRRILTALIAAVTILMIPCALHITLDRTLKSAYVTSSEAYRIYRHFTETFGDDEFILIAVKTARDVRDPRILSALRKITDSVEEIPEVGRVISVTNLKMVQNRKGVFGSYPVVEEVDGSPALPEKDRLDRIRGALPLFDFLLSQDLTTAGIMVRIKDEWKFHPKMGDIQDRIAGVVKRGLPEDSDFRLVGAPVIREAVQRLTVRTAVTFGALCTLVITLVSLYIFKSLRVAGITVVVVGVAVLWIIGFMALIGIPLNSTTSLSFGLVLVVSVATVVHIVTHYYGSSREFSEKTDAVKHALDAVGRPCLMCALTTSIAFATIMVSTIPMVQQLGLVMSLGVLLAFIVSMTLTPAFLIALKPIDRRTHSRMSGDAVAWIFDEMEGFVFRRPRVCATAGIILAAVMLAGAPLITIDTQILRLFLDSSREIQDIKFVNQHLAPAQSLELVVEKDDRAFRKSDAWRTVTELQERLSSLPQVERVDSPLPLLEYIHELLAKDGRPDTDLFANEKLIPQLMQLVKFTPEGKLLLKKYVDEDLSRLHVSVRMKGPASEPVTTAIENVDRSAREVVAQKGNTVVTGELAVFAAQASEVVFSQVVSLALALTSITALIMIQFRSFRLGILSLIPNVLPVAVIFGLMGWFGIALDNVTVFAATIAIGLAVDDTIHYLSRLKRELPAWRSGEKSLEQWLSDAYQSTAKALIATSLTLIFGFLMLTLTPTRPAISFGFLGAAAILAALLGDLVFMPSIILSFPRVRRWISR